MTIGTANLSPSPAEAQHHLQHDDLVQRLKAMPTATARTSPTITATRSPKSDSISPFQIVQDGVSKPTSSTTDTQLPHKHADSLPEETETMGEGSTLARQLSNTSDDSMTSRRPTTPRSQTAPSFETTPASSLTQPRNRSPYSRSHMRSQSGPGLNAPPMTRAHSLPTVMHPTGNLTLSPSPVPLNRSSSPLRSPKRTRSPRGLEPRPLTAGPHDRYGSGIRPASVGSFEGAPSVCDISEDAELELTPRASSGVASLYSSTGSLSRRRRPASPLYQVFVPFGTPGTSSVSTPTSTASSPLLAPSKFNEHYPASLASSSVPSTPTSMRSRSPSISSLETIEDSPDAEDEALEADRIARLKAAADREDGGEERRSSLDVPEGRGRSLGFGKRDSRKRWSVCGAERRQDLDLETIWED
jgi:hypothetical protein